MQRRKNDIIIAVAAAALLALAVGHLTDCRSARQPSPSTASSAATAATPTLAQPRREAAERPGGEDREESEKIKSIAHALQTIGANPELRRTYGLPP